MFPYTLCLVQIPPAYGVSFGLMFRSGQLETYSLSKQTDSFRMMQIHQSLSTFFVTLHSLKGQPAADGGIIRRPEQCKDVFPSAKVQQEVKPRLCLIVLSPCRVVLLVDISRSLRHVSLVSKTSQGNSINAERMDCIRYSPRRRTSPPRRTPSWLQRRQQARRSWL